MDFAELLGEKQGGFHEKAESTVLARVCCFDIVCDFFMCPACGGCEGFLTRCPCVGGATFRCGEEALRCYGELSSCCRRLFSLAR